MPSLLFLLAAYGLAFFLTHKFNILDGKIAFLDRMMECSFCMGFHTGNLVFLAWGAAGGAANWLLLPLWGLASAAFCYSLDVLLQRLER